MKIAADLLDLVGDGAFETVQDLLAVSFSLNLTSFYIFSRNLIVLYWIKLS